MQFLYHADSKKFTPPLPENTAVVTDPPFNIGYKYHGFKDRESEETYYGFLATLVKNWPCVIVAYPEMICRLSIECEETPNRIISWVYNSNTARQHRDIAYFGIVPEMARVKQPYKNPNDKRIKARIARGLTGCRLYDWWNVNQVKNVSKKGLDHPCIMPLEVMRKAIGILPPEIETVYDPFMGTGTTGVACKEEGLDFFGVELVEQYYLEAKRRLEK